MADGSSATSQYSPAEVTAIIRDALSEQGRIGSNAIVLSETADLRLAGLSSFTSVNLALSIEARFGIEFPDRLLTKTTFATIASIRAAILEILSEPS